MANTEIRIKHSTVSGNTPTSLANGEIAINSQDGKLFYSTSNGTIKTIENFAGPAGLNGEIQFNDSGTLGASSNLTFDNEIGELSAEIVKSNTYIEFGDGTKQYTANVAGYTGSVGFTGSQGKHRIYWFTGYHWFYWFFRIHWIKRRHGIYW